MWDTRYLQKLAHNLDIPKPWDKRERFLAGVDPDTDLVLGL
jgi:hypothetical protein